MQSSMPLFGSNPPADMDTRTPYMVYGFVQENPATKPLATLQQYYGTGGYYRLPAMAETPEEIVALVKQVHPKLLVYSVVTLTQLKAEQARLSAEGVSRHMPAFMVFAAAKDDVFRAARHSAPNDTDIPSVRRIDEFQIFRYRVSANSVSEALELVAKADPGIHILGYLSRESIASDIKCLESYIAAEQAAVA